MTRVLVTGALHREPERRTSKSGTPYAVATVRAGTGDAVEWWSAIAFSETAQAELLRLRAGDSLSLQGRLEVETFEGRDGATRIALKVIADSVLALRQPPRSKRKPDSATQRQDELDMRPTREPCAADPELDDAIPF